MSRLSVDEHVDQLVAKMPRISRRQGEAAARILASVEPSHVTPAASDTCDHVLMRPGCGSCESRFQARTDKASA